MVDSIELNPPRDHLDTRIIDDVLRHLKTEPDENLALRTALLLAVRLLQQEEDLPAQDFVEAMLTSFAPLAGKFDANNEHPFCGGYKVARVTPEDCNVKVTLPMEYIRYVGGQDLDPGSLK